MNIIICIASMSNDRLQDLIRCLGKCHFVGKNYKVIIVGTGENIYLNPINEDVTRIDPIIIQRENKKRWYAEVMKEKLEAVKDFASNDTIVGMFDDDYDFNPYCLSVIKKVFEENSQVDYLSLLKGPGLTGENVEKLSGFDFVKTHSCMGGSVVAKWSIFKHDMDNFFEVYGYENQWDQLFWQFLNEKYLREEHVYTLYNFSLVQHTNLISHYRNTKDSIRSHMYGVDFESRGNPFLILDIDETPKM